VVVLTLVTLVVLIGFAALTLDVGALYNTRADLQNAADAAALAGGSALAGDAMLRVRQGSNSSSVTAEAGALILERAESAGLLNYSFASSGTVIPPGDIVSGWIDLSSSTSSIDPSRPFSRHNAVHVYVRRMQGSANGPVDFFFASIFGKSEGDVTASAVAAFDDRVSGYDTGAGGGDLWPFTINLIDYDNQVAAGNDIYDYDAGAGNVLSGGDGMPEVNIYPANLAPGNFGLLNIGVGNQGTPALADHIENGVPPEHVENEIGTSELTFYDDDGYATTYNITGNPGLKASLESAIQTRIGDVVGILVHDQVSGSGANTVYRITGIRFARVMNVKLQGSSKSRRLWLQPVSYSGAGVVTSTGAPSSGGAAGKLVLVR
jgi:hypothetical protein